MFVFRNKIKPLKDILNNILKVLLLHFPLGFSTLYIYRCILVQGSGIFVSPSGLLERTGSVGISFIIWMACGLLSLLGECYEYTFLRVLVYQRCAHVACQTYQQ